MHNKMFKNPAMYTNTLDICEYGTNYGKEFFNPHEWTAKDEYESLANKQMKVNTKKQEKIQMAQISGLILKVTLPIGQSCS